MCQLGVGLPLGSWGTELTRWPCPTHGARHMGKVPDDNAPLVHHLLALDPDAGAAAQGAVRVVRVGAVDAELDGAGARVDGGVAVGQGTG